MTHSNQTSGVERGAARVRHNRPSKGVLEFPLPRDVPEMWFQIFLLKKSDTYPDNFDSSKKRISWVGSLFKDNALVWHKYRAKIIRDLALPDNTWKSYKNALKTRFKDMAKPTRNLRKIRALLYKDNIA